MAMPLILIISSNTITKRQLYEESICYHFSFLDFDVIASIAYEST